MRARSSRSAGSNARRSRRAVASGGSSGPRGPSPALRSRGIAPSSALARHRRELLRLVLARERVEDLVEVAVHDRVDAVEREVDPVVGDAALREVVGADALAPVARADQALARRGRLRLLLAQLLVADARGKDA